VVIFSASVRPPCAWALLAQAASPDKLSPPASAAVMMALLGIALLGLLIIVVILLGGSWARKQGNFRRGPSVPPDRSPLPRRSTDSEATANDENTAPPQAGVDTVRNRPNRDETIS
jgi:hypothetical protein